MAIASHPLNTGRNLSIRGQPVRPGIERLKNRKQNGIKLARMNALLLQKVEELTLYVIELEKKIDKKNK